MNLRELLAGVTVKRFEGAEGIEINGISYHSLKCEPGCLFVCIKGFKTDGHFYIEEAFKKGALGAVVEEWQDNPALFEGKIQILVPDSRQALAMLAANFFSHPSKKLNLIGVTGTNGKTTTTYLIESILTSAGYRAGLLGTLSARLGREILPQERTTPESYDLQKTLSTMLQRGAEFVVAEISSHAIDLNRIYGCSFKEAIFTNLSQDHLDYHKTLEEYFQVKKRFFNGEVERSIINIDDVFGRRIREGKPDSLSYAVREQADITASGLKFNGKGSSFFIRTPKGSFQACLKLNGLFNVYNALAATAAAIVFDVPLEAIEKGLEAVESIPGRFERVEVGQGFMVIVDYAHTPDSLKEALLASREMTKGKIITVFGCGGDRDRHKRPLMGEAAATLSDFTILTSDNPRSEDPEAIIREIEEGMKEVPKAQYRKIVDRREAIAEALRAAQPGDLILIAGKGHEKEQIFADKIVPFDDRMIVIDLIKETGAAK